ncbi:MAG: NAD(P)-dependent oxidoreductase [Patescibacteria group bacterium]
MSQIVFTGIEGWEEPYLQERLTGHQLTFIRRALQKQDFGGLRRTEILSPFIYTPINDELLDQLPELKFIATRSTGFDHIDVEACHQRGIKVANVPFYGENTVAEHTWALILALSRKIFQSYERTERGDFSLDGLRGFDLKGKTIGVIGGGHIGQHVIRIAKAFGMKVVVFDVKQDVALAKNMGFEYASLDALLKESDVITLHAPYNKKTHHLLNADSMKLIKQGAVLVNTARGGLVDTIELVKVLESGRLAGAGLDVLEEENFIKEESELLTPEFKNKCDLKTLIADHVLLQRNNVIITPHNAFNSQEAIMRILDTTIENIKGFLEGKIINQVK